MISGESHETRIRAIQMKFMKHFYLDKNNIINIVDILHLKKQQHKNQDVETLEFLIFNI